MRSIVSALRDAARSRAGNFAVPVAILALPMILALGGAMDLSMLHNASQRAQSAAESAALAAAVRLQSGTVEQAKEELKVYGAANLTGDLAGTVLTGTIDIPGGKVTVTAKGSVKPSFLKLAQISELTYERVAEVAIRQEAFVEVHLLLDMSESMNIAASDDDRDKLRETTRRGNNRPCAFACHTWENLPWPMATRYSVAEMNDNAGANKARLRIDVVREAAGKMIHRLLDKNSAPDALLKVSFQTATFNQAFYPGVGPSTNEAALMASINGAKADGHTNFTTALTKFSDQLGMQGDGRTDKTPTKVALIITDGVDDVDFATGPIKPTPLCSQIKVDKKIDLAVLEIKYIYDPTKDEQGYFKQHVSRFYPYISENLQKCASTDLHDLATDADQSAAKMVALVEKLVTNGLRVTR